MSENYKIMSKFIKDISGETPDIETYLYVKDLISKYQLFRTSQAYFQKIL